MQLYQPGARSRNRLCPPDDSTKSGDSAIEKKQDGGISHRKEGGEEWSVPVPMAIGVLLTVEAAEEHVWSNPEVPQGKGIERERGSLCWWGTLLRSMFCVKAGTWLWVQIGSTISFFMQFLQINLSVRQKWGEDMHGDLPVGYVKWRLD